MAGSTEYVAPGENPRIWFPAVAATYSRSGAVTFLANVDGMEVICEISPEALEDHFGATRDQPSYLLSAFEAHRMEIQLVAARILPHRLTDRRCLLFSQDFT